MKNNFTVKDSEIREVGSYHVRAENGFPTSLTEKSNKHYPSDFKEEVVL